VINGMRLVGGAATDALSAIFKASLAKKMAEKGRTE
jgi:hypothetical protein